MTNFSKKCCNSDFNVLHHNELLLPGRGAAMKYGSAEWENVLGTLSLGCWGWVADGDCMTRRPNHFRQTWGSLLQLYHLLYTPNLRLWDPQQSWTLSISLRRSRATAMLSVSYISSRLFPAGWFNSAVVKPWQGMCFRSKVNSSGQIVV